MEPTIVTAAVANGNFNVFDPQAPAFAWRLRGETDVVDGIAVLAEQTEYLSSFSQRFTVPENAVSFAIRYSRRPVKRVDRALRSMRFRSAC